LISSVLHSLKKFKYELDIVRLNSESFSLLLHLNLWFKDRALGLSPLQAGFPWINYVIIQFLHHYLKPGMRVLEFGAGGSSVFFLKRKVNLFSIEHKNSWLIEVQRILSPKQLKNWVPHYSRSSNSNDQTPVAEDYLSNIESIADSSIEIALIDGRNRVECIRQSISKIKPGGCIILDNSDRPAYAIAYQLLNKWSLKETTCITNASNHVTPATIWFKPHL
jgi:hypothetical protein